MLHVVQRFMMHGRHLASQEFVVLDPERNRGLAVVGCGLDPHHSRAATHAKIFTHGDFGWHGESDLNRLPLAQRKIGADERSPRTQIQSETVAGLPIAVS